MSAATYEVYAGEGVYDFRRPDLSDLTVEEIAVSLGRLYRWRGSIPVSVGQHSVLLARYAEGLPTARWCLMHDATEIFVGDCPSPLKHLGLMAGFRAAEARFHQAIQERFDLGPEPKAVKRLDRRICRDEVDAYLPSALDAVKSVRPLGVEIIPAWTPAQSRDAFLAEARRLGIE
jgi:hypothetical protein